MTYTELNDPALFSAQEKDAFEPSTIVQNDFSSALLKYGQSSSTRPLLLNGDCLDVLKSLPDESVDFAMTSRRTGGSGNIKTAG